MQRKLCVFKSHFQGFICSYTPIENWCNDPKTVYVFLFIVTLVERRSIHEYENYDRTKK